MTSKDGTGEIMRQIDQSKGAMGGMKDKASNPASPSGLKFALVMLSAFLAMFLVSLDKLIISTAIPQITDTFNSKDDIGWYGTAYLLTNCSFQLVFGKLYKFLPVKTTFLASLLLFEVGSALCGAAPNSIAFIFGRVIAGLGAGGVLPGVMVIIVYTVPLQKRPKYQGVFGAVFGVASLLGPTVGGAFTTNVTWRWCFYINLPIGGAVMVLVFLLLHVPDQPGTKISPKEKLYQANLLGFICLVPGIICLCLVLQWGGTTYSWNNGRIIALFVVSFLLLIAFILVQILLPEQAILPPRLFLQRSIASGVWASMCIGAHQTIILYYLPIWFQAIQGQSAVKSGIDLLPMVLLTAATSILNGQLVSYIGYYTPSLIFGVCFSAIGAGLFTTLGVYASEGEWIGYQILYGVGLGLASQAPNMAAQTVLPKQDVAIGASLMFFGQTLFGAVFVSVGQNVLNAQLTNRLSDIPGISSELIQSVGATDFLDSISTQYRAAALQSYNDSLRVVFVVALCMACLAILGAVTMEWLTVKRKVPPKNLTGDHAAERGHGPGSTSEKGASGASKLVVNAAGNEAYKEKDASATNPMTNERKTALP
ncbi:putative MFS multidrug transporter [Annulohypoxylon maeteangense]|uniref:putative MFS multidrug transporter n=1 Tax=Annulohypoxylon maeteangense TaxID=1927788 RepID=UPI002007D9F4|nr:putative MFS multidrug transporter [Annulohypoxylon maeteangense]KAI0881985.1 putative MFS multidrug transporter [Annulohypoxylon maeteangense]